MASINNQVKQCMGLLGTKDITPWEERFLTTVVAWTEEGKDTSKLTEAQVDTLEKIHSKHFAS